MELINSIDTGTLEIIIFVIYVILCYILPKPYSTYLTMIPELIHKMGQTPGGLKIKHKNKERTK